MILIIISDLHKFISDYCCLLVIVWIVRASMVVMLSTQWYGGKQLTKMENQSLENVFEILK